MLIPAWKSVIFFYFPMKMRFDFFMVYARQDTVIVCCHETRKINNVAATKKIWVFRFSLLWCMAFWPHAGFFIIFRMIIRIMIPTASASLPLLLVKKNVFNQGYHQEALGRKKERLVRASA